MHGTNNVYFIDGENEKQIPETLAERKELFVSNKEGNKYIIKLNEVALTRSRTIVDIPEF
jgi:hypothetical protein